MTVRQYATRAASPTAIGNNMSVCIRYEKDGSPRDEVQQE
jgi:hypothetical protein